jgi:hypothetical protein
MDIDRVGSRPVSWPVSRSALRRIVTGISSGLLVVGAAAPADANNLNENSAWQFRTSADNANQAAILDLIAKRRGGYYAAPIYTTNIAHQVNCSVAASAVGNSNGQSAVASSPTVTGASSTSTGNANSSSVEAGRGGGSAASQQSNNGAVSADVTGATDTSVRGSAWQALNSVQSNGGTQSADVQNSNACSFAALN